jgi:hypothetical protein
LSLRDSLRLSLRKGEGRVRVQRRAQIECRMKPLTSILSPCARGEAGDPLYWDTLPVS